MARKKQDQQTWNEAISHLKAADPKLAGLIDRVGPCQLKPAGDYLKTLAQAIISQQISSKAAETIFGRVAGVMPDVWTVQAMAKMDSDFLQSCGVSQQKRNYLLSLMEHVGSGKLDLGKIQLLDDEGIIETLVQVKGIGRWTAEMFLIFALNRPNVLPVADLGIKEGLKRHFELPGHPTPQQCKELTEAWQPYRSVAMWYLWRMGELKSS